MIPVAILCGGRGTRLAPLTDDCPKSLIEVCGRPFIAHQFDLLRQGGYTDIVLLAGHRAEQIEAIVGDGSRYGVQVRYALDGAKALGTNGAIRQALPMLGDRFFVLYGDSYLDCDYAGIEHVFRTSGRDALLTLARGVDYGLRGFRAGRFPPASIVEYPMAQDFEEIGSPDGLERVRSRLGFAGAYLRETAAVMDALSLKTIDRMAQTLHDVGHAGGRVFVLGVGGSAANASHAVNDLRKIAGLEAYAPTDNAAELTARTNDEGWAHSFSHWLEVSHLRDTDAVLVLSVGGGSALASPNICEALALVDGCGAEILGIVGRDGGETARLADLCLLIPNLYPAHVTPHAESLQLVVLHLLVNHPIWSQP